MKKTLNFNKPKHFLTVKKGVPPSPQDDPWPSNITSRLYKSFTSSWNTKKNISQFNNEVWFIWSADDNKQTDYLCWWVASWTISGNNLEKIRLWQDSNLCLPNTNWTLLPTETMAQMVLKLKNFTDMNLTFRFNFFFYRFKSFLKTALLFAI